MLPLPPIPGLMPETHLGYRYQVLTKRDPVAVFTEVILPTITMETEDVKEGGQNKFIHKLPGRINAGTVKFKHGIAIVDMMMKWYVDVIEKQKYGKATDELIVVQLTPSPLPIPLPFPLRIWVFHDAYPIKWTGPQLQSSQSAAIVEEFEFAHSGITVENAATLASSLF